MSQYSYITKNYEIWGCENKGCVISSKNFVKTSQFNIPWNLNCMKFDWGVVRTRKLVIFRIILINWNWNYHKKEVEPAKCTCVNSQWNQTNWWSDVASSLLIYFSEFQCLIGEAGKGILFLCGSISCYQFIQSIIVILIHVIMRVPFFKCFLFTYQFFLAIV